MFGGFSLQENSRRREMPQIYEIIFTLFMEGNFKEKRLSVKEELHSIFDI